MGHYECHKCGVYLCSGDCDDPEVIARKVRQYHLERIRDSQKVLDDELKRRERMHKAKHILLEENAYKEKYDIIFEGDANAISGM